ncbi:MULTISPECIES: MDR family MFS transporter [Microbacterium]|uniref:MDR family MFS transporter n=1 Tax=Microbacterium TaxID=33882 RepID=UPI002780B8AA|nr:MULTISPECIES: MDR family MFS transporter [Microbacterium]MDQ1075455.1 DHA2 family lincomycin resistance protein-like MFS transporter [Microbacterium sp. SORGH_AS_0969]MDQ1115689.1 DHA2 family lincomycin resistance protein-like MFS transporter [Microbacterium testaceum]
MVATGTVPAAAPPGKPAVRPGAVIALLVVAAFVVILNETVMGVALPELMRELDISAATAQWLTTAFLLTMAVVIPTTGFLIQRLPLRTLFFTAMGLFTLGTVIASFAPGFGVLLVGRIVQACGTAIMLPLLFTTVLNVVPAHRRGRMMGLISIVISVAPAIGPTVSGLILSVFPWRGMFMVMVPIALVAIALGARWVRNLTETRRVTLDVISVVLSALAFGGLIFGLSSIGEAASGHAIVPVWIPLVVGVVALAVFVVRQLRLGSTDRVLLNLGVFRHSSFTLAVILVVVAMTMLFGVLILLPIYLQNVLGLGTLQTGLLLLPGGLLMGLMAPLVGNLFDRFGARPLVLPGAIIASLGLWGFATLSTETAAGFVIAVHCVLSLGLAFMFTPLMTSALGSLPRELYPHGSAIVSTVQQLAGAAGTAVFVTLMTVGAASAVSGGASVVDATATGIHSAFFLAACLSIAVIVLAVFVRTPKPAEGVEGVPAH